MNARKLTHLVAAIAATGALGAFAALPQVTNVSIRQVGGKVKVSYTLSGGAAVVTADFQTNSVDKGWVSIGAENCRTLSGDVNRRVEAGNRAFSWKSRDDGAAFRFDDDGLRAVLKVHDVTQPPDWMTLELKSGAVRYYDCEEALPGGFESDAYKTTHVLLRKIPAAGMSFLMGCCDYEGGNGGTSETSSEVQHEVILTNDFYMAVYETTKAQYGAVISTYAYDAAEARFPVSSQTWYALRGANWPENGHTFGASSFFGVLAARGANLFDLPTEAQWEFACRAGMSGVLHNGRDNVNVAATGSDKPLEEIAWCSTVAGGAAHEVGLKKPNAWKLYDMLGNLREFCLDGHVSDLGKETVVEPVGPSGIQNRVSRGGTFVYNTSNQRIARRVNRSQSTSDQYEGFRIWGEAVAR